MTSELTVINDSDVDYGAQSEYSRKLDPTKIDGSVYLAYPLHMHNTARARRFLRLAQRRFPNAEILAACNQFSSNADWLRRWPLILPTIAAVCVVTDEDGWVGKGVWVEVHDALARGIPVFAQTNKQVHSWHEVEFVEGDTGSWRHFAQLRLSGAAGVVTNG